MDIRTLDFQLLKAFHVLLEEGNVTRAAERLSLTQPAVSGMLNRLRDSFNDPLFVRAQRGVVATPRALALAAPVRQLLWEAEALLAPQTFDPAVADMTLAVAGTDYALQAVVVPFLQLLREQAPGIRVAMRPLQDNQVQQQLERGELDIALMTPVSAPKDLHARALFDEYYVCVMRDDHPLLGEGELTLGSFCSQHHALVSYAGGSFSGATDEALAAQGLSRRVMLSVPGFLLLPDILRTTDLLAMVPARLMRDCRGLALRTPPLSVPGFTKTLVWHERTHYSAAHVWLRELLATSCAAG